MGGHLGNILRLGFKELRSLVADPVLLGLIIWAFSVGIYAAASGMSQELRKAPIAIVDLDHSPLSARIAEAIYPPYFQTPRRIDLSQMDHLMDRGEITFGLVLPNKMQSDLAAGKHPTLQLNIDATNMSQSFIGASYIQSILSKELGVYQTGHQPVDSAPIGLDTRVRFNPNLTGSWFGGVVETINNITLLAIILVGAAVIREREHGTLEHLLVMPLTPMEIMAAKVWANGVVVVIGAAFALKVIVEGMLAVPISGSVPLFLACAAMYLFAAASIGIFLATVAHSMPQFGLLIILVVLPLEMLSGGITPRESMPQFVQDIMLFAPTTHFVKLAQIILFRGGGWSEVWRSMLAMTGIGAVFFLIAAARFRRSVANG